MHGLRAYFAPSRPQACSTLSARSLQSWKTQSDSHPERQKAGLVAPHWQEHHDVHTARRGRCLLLAVSSSVSAHRHSLPTRALLLLCPMQHCYIGRTASHTAFSCGRQVPDVAVPHYRDARMQHSPMQCPSYTAPRVGNSCGVSRSRTA